jgi:hypothetical protein
VEEKRRGRGEEEGRRVGRQRDEKEKRQLTKAIA